jgi:hypothetical protein
VSIPRIELIILLRLHIDIPKGIIYHLHNVVKQRADYGLIGGTPTGDARINLFT